MKIKYVDVIHSQEMEIDVSPQVAHFLKEEKLKEIKLSKKNYDKLPKHKKETYNQSRFENTMKSLQKMQKNGFQPIEKVTIEENIEKDEADKKLLNTHSYKKFREGLQDSIKKEFDTMSKSVKIAMYLRFFKGLSLSQIAKQMKVSISTARIYLGRGCGKIKKFLEKN